MENASNALLIGGGILIAMLIIGIGVYLFMTYSHVGDTYENILTANEMKKFNSNFIKFENRQDITAQEIVTLMNFVKDYNEKNEMNVQVHVNGIPTTDNIEFIKNSVGSDLRFKCNESNIQYDKGLVTSITFVKI